MTIDLTAVRDAILTLGALAVASAAIWRVWGKPVQTWFVEHEARKEERLVAIETALTCINERIASEFANGVPPDSPEYVPLRKAFDAHITWSLNMAGRFEEHNRHAAE